MARSIRHNENSQFWALPNHHDITTCHPRGREICHTGGQFVEDGWQGEGDRALMLGAEAPNLRVTVELDYKGTVSISLSCQHLLFFPTMVDKQHIDLVTANTSQGSNRIHTLTSYIVDSSFYACSLDSHIKFHASS